MKWFEKGICRLGFSKYLVSFSDPISNDIKKPRQEVLALQNQNQRFSPLKSVQDHRKHSINIVIRKLAREFLTLCFLILFKLQLSLLFLLFSSSQREEA